MLGLSGEVQLGLDHLADLVMVLVEVLDREEAVHDRQDAADGPEVLAHELFDADVLHLHGDEPAVLRRRAVHLAQGRRGDGSFVEAREPLVRVRAQLLADPARGDRVEPARVAVLELLQALAEFLGQ